MHANMKMDMSGAAAVLSAMSALKALRCRAKVTGYLMCTDNRPSGSALAMSCTSCTPAGSSPLMRSTLPLGTGAPHRGRRTRTKCGR